MSFTSSSSPSPSRCHARGVGSPSPSSSPSSSSADERMPGTVNRDPAPTPVARNGVKPSAGHQTAHWLARRRTRGRSSVVTVPHSAAARPRPFVAEGPGRRYDARAAQKHQAAERKKRLPPHADMVGNPVYTIWARMFPVASCKRALGSFTAGRFPHRRQRPCRTPRSFLATSRCLETLS